MHLLLLLFIFHIFLQFDSDFFCEFVFLEGQFRETLLCTTCGKVKRTFNSFTHLLTIFPRTLKTRVIVFSNDGIERHSQHTITMNEKGTY